MRRLHVLLWAVFFVICTASQPSHSQSFPNASAFLSNANSVLEKLSQSESLARFHWETFVKKDLTQAEYLQSRLSLWNEIDKIRREIPSVNFSFSQKEVRQLVLLKVKLLDLSLPLKAAQRSELNQLDLYMKLFFFQNYNYSSNNYHLDLSKATRYNATYPYTSLAPPIFYSRYLDMSPDSDGIRGTWDEWKRVGAYMLPLFNKMKKLANVGAQEAHFNDTGMMWKSQFDLNPDELEFFSERMWREIKPFYIQLHCYIRRKLRDRYGISHVPIHEPIPIHLLGDLFGENWVNIYEIAKPFKTKAESGYSDIATDAYDLLGYLERYWMSMGFESLPKSLFDYSVFKSTQEVKKEKMSSSCAPHLFEVGEDDFRMRLCMSEKKVSQNVIQMNMMVAETYFAKMGKDLPYIFRAGTNAAIKDSVASATLLGLLPEIIAQEKDNDGLDLEKRLINNQLLLALQTVASLPFDLIADKWRWGVFSMKDQSVPSSYNKEWWYMRRFYQGVDTPAGIVDDEHFDPGVTFKIGQNMPTISKFISTIVQFQIYRGLCGHLADSLNSGPLFNCSFAGRNEIGARIRSLMQSGGELPWQSLVSQIDHNSYGIESSALLEYFGPLRKWLAKVNQEETTIRGKVFTSIEQCGWDFHDPFLQTTYYEILGMVLGLLLCFVLLSTTISAILPRKSPKSVNSIPGGADKNAVSIEMGDMAHPRPVPIDLRVHSVDIPFRRHTRAESFGFHPDLEQSADYDFTQIAVKRGSSSELIRPKGFSTPDY
eukprot:TRINITY_DN4509_c0_g1_i1.p1 TRINITY_DN4509_c0_g1~~TRINITY_DN4509_c0_g1_i1.p1  ORF type:complete len:768 (+),score=160.32 TRINITY_DN4509_c0_g1_i1:2-2305(+)